MHFPSLINYEQRRHECEVRLVASWGKDRISAYLAKVQKIRTESAYKKLCSSLESVLEASNGTVSKG